MFSSGFAFEAGRCKRRCRGPVDPGSAPVERSVLYGFRDVTGEDVLRPVEVGHSAGNLEYPVVRAGARYKARDLSTSRNGPVSTVGPHGFHRLLRSCRAGQRSTAQTGLILSNTIRHNIHRLRVSFIVHTSSAIIKNHFSPYLIYEPGYRCAVFL